MPQMQLHLHRPDGSYSLLASRVSGLDTPVREAAGDLPAERPVHNSVVQNLRNLLRRVWPGLSSLPSDADQHLVAAGLPVLPGEERAGVQRSRISIPFTSHRDLHDTIIMPRALIAIGPGAAPLMLALNVRIDPPRCEQQVIMGGNGQPYIYNVGVRLGHFSAEKVIAGLQSWRSSALHASLTQHRAGTCLTVEAEDRGRVVDLKRFLITSVGHEVHTDSVHDHHVFTTTTVHHVQGHYWDAIRY